VTIDPNGRPTTASLQRVLAVLSRVAGQGGRIDGTYIPSQKFKKMNDYALKRLAQNNNPKRTTYGLLTNNCGTFASDTVKADPLVKHAWVIIDPTPINYVSEFQDEGYQKITYTPPTPTKPSHSTGGTPRPTTKPTPHPATQQHRKKAPAHGTRKPHVVPARPRPAKQRQFVR